MGRRWDFLNQAVAVEHWWGDEDGGAGTRGLDGWVVGAVCGHGSAVDGAEGVFAKGGVCLGVGEGFWPLLGDLRFLLGRGVG